MMRSANSPELDTFATTAREYLVALARTPHESIGGLLTDVEPRLVDLYGQILAIPLAFPEDDRPDDPLPIEELDRIRDSLRAVLGTADYYRVIFDPYEAESEGPVVSSLAQDLAEIYGDLYRGLRRWEEGDFLEASYEWRFAFQFHWGRHLVHALDAIWALHFDHSWEVPALNEREA